MPALLIGVSRKRPKCSTVTSVVSRPGAVVARDIGDDALDALAGAASS